MEAPIKEVHVRVVYEVSPDGTEVRESVAVGTSNETLLVYREQRGALTIEHDCRSGLQSDVQLLKATEHRLLFGPKEHSEDEASSCYLQELVLQFTDNDRMTRTWVGIKDCDVYPGVLELNFVGRDEAEVQMHKHARRPNELDVQHRIKSLK